MLKVFDTPEKRLQLLSESGARVAADMTSDLEEEIRVLNQFISSMIDVLTPDQVTMLLVEMKEYIEEDESELFAGASETQRSTVLDDLTSAIAQPVIGE